ncbi:MAG: ubiquitin-like small modifier protein 1 [Actinomycetota bacterium]|nr:ubiquitin-like small modifier protein 1 [Actinomycetota bacterium]
MPVSVRLPTVLRPHAGGQSSVEAEGATVGELVSDLVERFPGMAGHLTTPGGELQKFVNVYVNDEDVRYLDKLDTKVGESDEVSILPAVAGGES